MVIQYRIVYPDELNHYGVKGMKWGVRNDKPPRGRYAYKVEGKKAYNRSSESFSYGNSMYTVKKKPDGSYSISRTDVYVY